MRKDVLQFSCKLGLQDCIVTARKLYQEWMNDENVNNIPKNFRSFVYCTAVKYGSRHEWNFALNQYKKEVDSNSRKELQYGMSCTKEPWLINNYLNNQLDQSITRKQDGATGIIYSLFNPYSNLITWNFVKNNWDELVKRVQSKIRIFFFKLI